MTDRIHQCIVNAVLREMPDVGPWEVVVMVNLWTAESADHAASFATNVLPLGRAADWMRSTAEYIEREIS